MKPQTKLFSQLCCNKSNTESGYNLLMSAIALLVVGILMAGGFQAYAVYTKKEQASKTQQVIANAVSKIQSFKETFGRFPCPAPLNLARNNAAYGHEDCTTVIPVDTCAGGLCHMTGRTIPPAAAAEQLRVGTIPFRLLQIEEKDVYDAYGHRLVYAMTLNQGSTSTYRDGNGAIGLVDDSGQNLTNPADSVDYVIISHGPNGVGAYGYSGAQKIACPTVAVGGLEANNCIDMAVPPASPLRFASAPAATAGGANQFDDVIEYFSSNEPAMWRRNDANKDDIQTISNTNVAVGVNDPDVALDIAQSTAAAATAGVGSTWDGALRVVGTNAGGQTFGVRADSICNEAGTECFKPENFASAAGIAACPAGKYMVGIKGTGTDAVAECAPVKVSCTPPNVMTGLNASGVPICSPVSTNCLLANVQICNAGFTGFSIRNSNNPPFANPTPTSQKAVPDAGAGVHNAVYQLFDPGSYAANKAWASFRCSNGDWLWAGGTGGLCSCNPTIPPSSDCVAVPPSATCTGSGTCAGFATGATTIPYTWSAASCAWVGGVPGIGTCTCPAVAPSPAPAPVACPGGYNTGAQVPGYTWNPAPNICNWQADPSTCACNPANEVPPTTAGATRTIPTITTPCNGLPGFAGYSGNAVRVERFNATAGACRWEFDSWDTSACVCDSTPFHEPAPSTCNAACQNETTPAKNWYAYLNPGCVKTFQSTDASVCAPKPFSWQADPSSPPLTGQSSHGPIALNDPCNTNCMVNNVAGSTTACWAPEGGGLFKIFSCICKPQ